MCRLLMCSLLRCARWGLFLPLLCLLVLLPAATSSASETPETLQVPVAKLEQLQTNLERQKQINDSLMQVSGRQRNQIINLETALAEAQKQLATARRQQTALQLQIQRLIDLSKSQQETLRAANESFQKFSTEQKRTRLRVKAQRNAWEAVAACALIAFVVK